MQTTDQAESLADRLGRSFRALQLGGLVESPFPGIRSETGELATTRDAIGIPAITVASTPPTQLPVGGRSQDWHAPAVPQKDSHHEATCVKVWIRAGM